MISQNMILNHQMNHHSSQSDQIDQRQSSSNNSNNCTQKQNQNGIEYTPKRIRSPSLEDIYHEDDIQKKVIIKTTHQGKIQIVKIDKDAIYQQISTTNQKKKKKNTKSKSKSKTKNLQQLKDNSDKAKIQQKSDDKITSKSKNKSSKKKKKQHQSEDTQDKQQTNHKQKIQSVQEQSIAQKKSSKKKSKSKSKHKKAQNLSTEPSVLNGTLNPKEISKPNANTKCINNINKSGVTPTKKKYVQKQYSINQIQRQFSKISRKKRRKSNFYLDKIDSLKWGEPVGRGSKKLRQQMQVERKKQLQYDKQRKKELKQYYANLSLYTKKQEERQNVKVEQIISSDSSQDSSEQDSQESSNKSVSVQAKKQESNLVKNQTKIETHDQSFTVDNKMLTHIVELYLIQGVDFLNLSKCIPELSLKKLRHNICLLFAKGLDKITSNQQNKSNILISQWNKSEKKIIIKQLCRIKENNRLLNINNPQFGQYLSRILTSIYKQDITISTIEYQSAQKILDQFVLSMKSALYQKKNSQLSPNLKNEESLIFLEQFYCDIAYYLDQWTKDQQDHLIIAYLQHGNNYKSIIESKFTKKYRKNIKWHDEEIISTKINELILRGLNRLYDLTEPISLNQEQDQDSHQPNPSQKSQTFNDCIKHIYRQNRQCQLNFFTNYAQLVKRIYQTNSILSKQVNKKLIGLNLKSNHPDIQEAIKALHYFNQLPQWKINHKNSDQPVSQLHGNQ